MWKKFSTLDIVLTIILVVVYVPLSLWGGSQHWAGAADLLPFIMLLFGAVYIVFESIRLSSPVIGAALGGLVGFVMIVPGLFLRPVDVGTAVVLIPSTCIFGLVISTLSWSIKMRAKRKIVLLQALAMLKESNHIDESKLLSDIGAKVGLDEIQIREIVTKAQRQGIIPSQAKAGVPVEDKTGREENTSGQGRQAEVPREIRKWNWGAFLLHWIWGLGNNTYIALLACIPVVGLVMIFVLGANGNEWAWQNKRWDSVEHFRRVQKIWAYCGAGVWSVSVLLWILVLIANA